MNCSSNKTVTHPVKDVFIAEFNGDFSNDDGIIDLDNSQKIYLSQEFWDFFLKKFPLASSRIFKTKLNNIDTIFKLSDTSQLFFHPGYMDRLSFTRTLPDNIEEKEKSPQLDAYFIFSDSTEDSIKKKEKLKLREKELSEYQISDNVRQEYETIYKILSEHNEHKQYLIIFNKEFQNKFLSLYK